MLLTVYKQAVNYQRCSARYQNHMVDDLSVETLYRRFVQSQVSTSARE